MSRNRKARLWTWTPLNPAGCCSKGFNILWAPANSAVRFSLPRFNSNVKSWTDEIWDVISNTFTRTGRRYHSKRVLRGKHNPLLPLCNSKWKASELSKQCISGFSRLFLFQLMLNCYVHFFPPICRPHLLFIHFFEQWVLHGFIFIRQIHSLTVLDWKHLENLSIQLECSGALLLTIVGSSMIGLMDVLTASYRYFPRVIWGPLKQNSFIMAPVTMWFCVRESRGKCCKGHRSVKKKAWSVFSYFITDVASTWRISMTEGKAFSIRYLQVINWTSLFI